MLNMAVIVTSVTLLLVLAPGLWGEARQATGGGEGETVVAGEVIRPPSGGERNGATSANGEMIVVEGNEFEITLGCDPEGVCRWEPAGSLDQGAISLLGKADREDPGSPSGWVEAWSFMAASPGDAYVTFVMKGPGDPYPLRTEAWHVKVFEKE